MPDDFEDCWRLLRGPPPEPLPGQEPEPVMIRGFAWMGLGDSGGELAGLERQRTALRFDGEDMTAEFGPGIEATVSWTGLWLLSRGGKPFYSREFSVLYVEPEDTLTMRIKLEDTSGLLTRILESLNIL